MGKKPRVCHVITQLELGGAQDNTLTTVESLPEDRYETSLICGMGGMLDDRARTSLGSRCHFVPSLVREICPLRDTAAFFSLRKLFIEGRYDIVHTHSSKAGVIGRLAAASAGVPVILHTAHGWGFHDGQPSFLRNIFIACERVASRFTRTIVAVSDSTVRKGLDAGIGHPGQYVVVRSGIDPKPYRAPADISGLRKKFGVDPGRPLVSMVACLKPQKSPRDFLDIAARVRLDVSNVQFALAGDGEMRKDMEAGIIRQGLQDTVRLLGWRSDVPDLLRASDISLLTSRWEGLPRVFLESIAAGVPVIATRVDGAPEAVVDGVNGYLFAPGDTSGMARRISELLRAPAKLSSLRSGAASSWKDEFDIHHMVRQIDRLYQNLWQSGRA